MEPACTGRVLLIGIDDATVQGLARSPDLQGCSFQAACGEADGLRRLRRVCFDLVITSPATTLDEDLALVDEIRRIRRNVKVILLAPQPRPPG